MSDQEARDTLRQMLKDWDSATDEQRDRAMQLAAERADLRSQDPIIDWLIRRKDRAA